MVEPDPTTIIWRDLDWILAQPDGLNSNNVLSYFETLKMQTRFNDLKDLIMPLKKMKGIEFQVVQERPPALWVIRKQNRLSEWEVNLVATYYILNYNIFQAPSLYSIIGNRVVAQQDPAELFKFRNGVERAFKSTTIKMTQQWNQLTAGNQNDITISEQTPDQPPAQPSSPNQPNADNITKRRKKSEDSGKKKKKSIS
ncbi:MED6 mediator sub complex component-domain-containing protein [Gigaspora rosea]|uniref:Mediator of RNA polymerase II transcription subunit 6 n=1 Tax=Gigaspora rosea TaxID=44941 RepID=A0A397VPK0_9GLOM|nr:MED6 mediator sub complex component-domain-containing protein [Gigaspora rosea]